MTHLVHITLHHCLPADDVLAHGELQEVVSEGTGVQVNVLNHRVIQVLHMWLAVNRNTLIL